MIAASGPAEMDDLEGVLQGLRALWESQGGETSAESAERLL